MPDILTEKFKQHIADKLIEAADGTQGDRLYMFIAKNKAWANDAAPTTPVDVTANTDFQVWEDMIFAKKVTASSATRMIRRYDWTANTVYAQYEDRNTTTSGNNFFVFTSDYNVYKCLINNRGANSTVEPSGTSNTDFQTNDGYIWKFMYNVTPSDIFKFGEPNWIPIKKLESDDNSIQWTTQVAARKGAIDVVDIVNTGNTFNNYHNGSVQSAANSTTVTIASNANTTNDVYNGSMFYINNGKGVGQYKEIVDYNGSTKTITLASALTTIPNNTSRYNISPKVTITGSGANAQAIAVVNTTLRKVTSAFMVEKGSGYYDATVTVTANGLTGVVANTYIPPYGGHGSKAVEELFAKNILYNVKIEEDEGGLTFYGNNYRKIGLMINPTVASTGAVANASAYDLTTKIGFTANTGAWTVDEKITGGTSSASGIVAFSNSSTLRLTRTRGTFSNGETITGSNNSYTATISSIAKPLMKKYSGDVMYVSHIAPINRSDSQTENIKVLIKL